jgi:hypothetical protein
MKKIYVVLSVLVFVVSFLNAEFSYRLAEDRDVEELCELYHEFVDDDKQKLVVFSPDVQRSIIQENIEKQRLFLSYDNDAKCIVSFLKMYVVPSEELSDILEHELCLTTENQLTKDVCYFLPIEDILHENELMPLSAINSEDANVFALEKPVKGILRNGTQDSCAYIYYGSAYTKQNYRGSGINTMLQRVAMGSLRNQFSANRFVVLLYGQVNENVSSCGMIRVFSDAIRTAFLFMETDRIVLHHLRCRAYKPDFDEQGNLVMVCDEAHEGRGNMVIYQV